MDTPLAEALRRLAAGSGTRIDVNWGELQALDFHAKVRVTARFTGDVALGAALHHILHNSGRPKRPEVFADGEGILIARHAPRPPQYLVRVYDVGPLLSAIPDEPLPPPPPVYLIRGRPLRGNTVQGLPSTRAAARATLVLMLQGQGISRASYIMMDDQVLSIFRPTYTPERVYEYGDRLVVVQTEYEQWRIAKYVRDVKLTWDAQRGRAVARNADDTIAR